MARKVTTVLSLRDNYTAVIKKARRYTSAFDKDVKKMTARLDAASKKKHDLKVKNSAAMKALSAVEKKIAPMRNVMVKVAAHVQHFKHQIKPVTDTFKKIATKAWTVTLKVKDGVSFVLTKINTALKKVGKGVAIGAAAVLGAGGYAINKGMELEGYDVSMSHFVGVNNPNANAAQVQKQTKDYMDWLRQNANATPFGTGEVIQAGSRAVQIAEGNTAAAQGLVKMAEDMAALTPGKTIMDAMEALADAQMGEMERMKEFGFKMTSEDFKKAGMDLFSTKSVTGKTLVEVFGGGAEKFAKTTAGMMSTITGELESQIADVGLRMAKEMQPFLQWVLDTAIPDLKKFLFEPLKEGGPTGVQVITNALKDAYYWLRDSIPQAIDWLIDTWNRLSAALQDPNNAINKILKILGIDFGTTGSTNDTGTKTGAGDTPSTDGPNIDLGKTWDVVKGLGALGLLKKGVSFLSSLATKGGAVGTAAAGVSSVASNAATAVAAASPAANAAMVNGTASLTTIMNAGGSTFLPAFGTWFENNLRVWEQEYANSHTTKADTATLDGMNKVLGWKMADTNAYIDKNVKEWGNNFNATMDSIFGIKRLPNGFPDLEAMFGGNKIDYTGMQAYQAIIKAHPDTSGMADAAAGLTDVGDAAGYAADEMERLLQYMSQTRSGGMGNPHGNANPRNPNPHAAGIKRVPFDNYPALLHKGETVLPSGEAGEYRGRGNKAEKAAPVFNLNITVNGANMDENRLASFLVNKLQEVALNTA